MHACMHVLEIAAVDTTRHVSFLSCIQASKEGKRPKPEPDNPSGLLGPSNPDIGFLKTHGGHAKIFTVVPKS